MSAIIISFQVLLVMLVLPVIHVESINQIAPTIDYSHNMRILKLPKWTPVGTLVYRLKGSDADQNTQLSFGFAGQEARNLLDIVPVINSWNEADVYLRNPLIPAAIQHQQQQTQQYNLSLFVSDGNMTTQVESTIIVTDPELDGGTEFGPISNDILGQQQQAFVNARHIFSVAENALPDEILGQVSVIESDSNDLPVRFELRGKGSDKFTLKYVFGPRGQSRADLVLAQPVDYERQNLYQLKILALNAWTDTKWDTRNVVTMDIVITVIDVQDTGPIFKSAPNNLRLTNQMETGHLVAQIEAEDGDSGDQRPVYYALDSVSPLVNFFQINKQNGQLRLTRPVRDLLAATNIATCSPDSSAWSTLTVIASEPPDPVTYDRLWPPMYSKLELPLYLVDVHNEAPQFLGGWQSKNEQELRKSPVAHMQATESILHAYIEEPIGSNPSGLSVHWYTNGSNLEQNHPRPYVVDLGLGLNGTFELYLEGRDSGLFRIEPSTSVTKQTNINLFVIDQLTPSNWSLFDRESQNSVTNFVIDIVAKDFGSPQRLSSRIKCQIDLIDINDSFPEFETDLYQFSVFEGAAKGQLIGILKARDRDASSNKRNLRYGPLTGFNSHLFKLNQDNGQLTLDSSLDREREPNHLLLAQVSDLTSGHKNYTKIMISVQDINDQGPIFEQSHYEAILLPDGSFAKPLIVRAHDADEVGTENSQIAYEIIAGNRDDQFSIDSQTGLIYPESSNQQSNAANQNQQQRPNSFRMPPALIAPISPFPQPANGRILPYNSHEIEETTWKSASKVSDDINEQQSQHELPNLGLDGGLRAASKRTAGNHNANNLLPPPPSPLNAHSNLNTDPLFSLASDTSPLFTRSLMNHFEQRYSAQASKLPPIITLVVRAHDFGIPLRSSTVPVNIYNQAQLSRTLSVIMNGTADQLENRRDSFERAFSSVTGSRASIESIESLSDSSSLSVAHVRLTMAPHNLVDLTDLTSLLESLDYHPRVDTYSHSYPPQHETSGQPDSKHRPQHNAFGLPTTALANLSSNGLVPIFNEGSSINPIDSATTIESYNTIERKLLIYIIIVAICILSLLILWMIYSCKQSDNLQNQTKFKSSYNTLNDSEGKGPQSSTTPKEHSFVYRDQGTSTRKSSNSQSNIWMTELDRRNNQNLNIPYSVINNQIGTGASLLNVNPDHEHHILGPTSLRPSDRLSMYNGQVWFEPMALGLHHPANRYQQTATNMAQHRDGLPIKTHNRRASSAPSVNGSMSSDVNTSRDGRGQFFPNTIGYTQNLASIDRQNFTSAKNQRIRGHSSKGRTKRDNKHRIVPLDSGNLVNSDRTKSTRYISRETHEEGRLKRRTSLSSGSGNSSYSGPGNNATDNQLQNEPYSNGNDRDGADGETLILDSDQELLGFDSTGTPIIATVTDPRKSNHLARGSSLTKEIRSQYEISRVGVPTNQSKHLATGVGAETRTGTGSKAEPDSQTKQSNPEDTKKGELDPEPNLDDVKQNRDGPVSSTNQSNQMESDSKEGDEFKNNKTSVDEQISTESTVMNESKDKPLDDKDPTSNNIKVKTSQQQRPKLTRTGTNSVLSSSSSQTKDQVQSHDTQVLEAHSSKSNIIFEDDMKNGDLLKKDSIFAQTYRNLASKNVPAICREID